MHGLIVNEEWMMKTLKHNANDDAEQMVLDLLELMASDSWLTEYKDSCIKSQCIFFEFYDFNKWSYVSFKTSSQSSGRNYIIHEIAIDENTNLIVKFPIGKPANVVCHVELIYQNAYFINGQIVQLAK
jgi:hypothetical protein